MSISKNGHLLISSYYDCSETLTCFICQNIDKIKYVEFTGGGETFDPVGLANTINCINKNHSIDVDFLHFRNNQYLSSILSHYDNRYNTSFISLNLNYCESQEWDRLFRHMQKCTQLYASFLRGPFVLQMLQKLTSVTQLLSLKIQLNQPFEETSKTIDWIDSNKSLTRLTLDWNSSKGAELSNWFAKTKTQIKSLILRSDTILNQTFFGSEAARNLTILRIQVPISGNNEFLSFSKFIGEKNALEELDFEIVDSNITTLLSKNIRNHKTLTDLSIQFRSSNDNPFIGEFLCDLKLKLNLTKFRVSGIPNITSLNRDTIIVGIQGLITSNSSMKELSVSWNYRTDFSLGDCLTLAQATYKNTTIRKINIGNELLANVTENWFLPPQFTNKSLIMSKWNMLGYIQYKNDTKQSIPSTAIKKTAFLIWVLKHFVPKDIVLNHILESTWWDDSDIDGTYWPCKSIVKNETKLIK